MSLESNLGMAVATLARWSGVSRPRSRILCYHEIGEGLSARYTNATSDFVRQLEWLLGNGYRFVTVREITENWPQIAEERIVVLTFDDGLRSHLEVVAPLLKGRGVSGTFFVPAGLICDAHASAMARGLTGYVDSMMMSWSDVRELAEMGFEIGSHSLNHKSVAKQSENDIRREIVESKSILEQQLGQSVITFGYPFGRRGSFSQATKRIAQESGYKAACTTMGWALNRRVDLMELPRTGLSAVDTMESFVQKMNGDWDFYSRLSALR